ncbi:MAG: DUF5395 family protein [Archaeoglobaceae archaeon]
MKFFFILRHENKWVAEGHGLTVAGSSLEELDKNIAKILKEKGYSGRLEIQMSFDYSTFPHWMTQFHPYYFNRTVVFEIDGK